MIRLPYPPSTNNLYATFRGRRIKSREGRAYKDAAGAMLRAVRVPMLAGPVHLVIHIYRPRRAGDLDGRLKAVIDAMSGIAFSDDEQVERIDAMRFEDKHDPRVEVLIQELPHA